MINTSPPLSSRSKMADMGWLDGFINFFVANEGENLYLPNTRLFYMANCKSSWPNQGHSSSTVGQPKRRRVFNGPSKGGPMEEITIRAEESFVNMDESSIFMSISWSDGSKEECVLQNIFTRPLVREGSVCLHIFLVIVMWHAPITERPLVTVALLSDDDGRWMAIKDLS